MVYGCCLDTLKLGELLVLFLGWLKVETDRRLGPWVRKLRSLSFSLSLRSDLWNTDFGNGILSSINCVVILLEAELALHEFFGWANPWNLS
ncbi:hypothetical protein V6N13_010882 [Hibiscus sabdariffa]